MQSPERQGAAASMSRARFGTRAPPPPPHVGPAARLHRARRWPPRADDCPERDACAESACIDEPTKTHSHARGSSGGELGSTSPLHAGARTRWHHMPSDSRARGAHDLGDGDARQIGTKARAVARAPGTAHQERRPPWQLRPRRFYPPRSRRRTASVAPRRAAPGGRARRPSTKVLPDRLSSSWGAVRQHFAEVQT